MANRHRGEIEAELGGQNYTLVLTLGALAEIEDAYGGEDMIAIAERFEGGRIKASDAIKVIGVACAARDLPSATMKWPSFQYWGELRDIWRSWLIS